MQNGQGKADRPFAPLVFQSLGPVKLFPHIGRHLVVKGRLPVRQFVGHGVGPALREQGAAIKFEQLLLNQPPHQIRGVAGVDAIPKAALKAVAIEQGHKKLKILFFAVVRGSR